MTPGAAASWAGAAPVAQLSERELEVLKLLAACEHSQEMADVPHGLIQDTGPSARRE